MSAFEFNHKAKVVWVKPEDGGRKTPPLPSTHPYSTLVRFDVWKDQKPLGSDWSIVMNIVEPANSDGEMIVELCFLVPNAPVEALAEGNKFQVFEGTRMVCTGVVL